MEDFEGLGFTGYRFSTFEEELQRSIHERHELWGSSFPFGQFGGNVGSQIQVVNFNLPAWCARRWTVHLMPMRYTGGTVLGPLFGATLWGNPSGGTGKMDPDLTNFSVVDCVLNFGVGGMVDQNILVDYPIRGGSFEVQASMLQVQLSLLGNFPASAQLQPTLGVFVVPSGKTGNTANNQNAVYTPKSGSTTTFTLATGAKAQIVVPKRARSYTLFVKNDVFANSVTFRVQQCDAAGGEIQQDLNNEDLVDTTDDRYWLFGGSFGPPLNPNTATIVITNTTAVVAGTFGVRFNLDLG